MATPQDFAATLARALDLFRDPGAKEEQKTQFRTLAGMLKAAAVTIGASDGALLVNGTVVDGGTLLQRLELHSVKEIAIPADPPVTEVFDLLRALADQPGDEDVASRLRGNGKRITITMQTFQFAAPPSPAPAAPAPPAPRKSAREVAAPAQLNPDDDIPAIVREATLESMAFSPAVASTRSTADLIAQLKEKPDGPQVGELLAVLGRQLETAMKANRTLQALA